MHYLLDTNICIYLIKKRPHRAFEKFRQHSPQDVAISTITLFELAYGVEKSQYPQQSREALVKFLSLLNLLHFAVGIVTRVEKPQRNEKLERFCAEGIFVNMLRSTIVKRALQQGFSGRSRWLLHNLG